MWAPVLLGRMIAGGGGTRGLPGLPCKIAFRHARRPNRNVKDAVGMLINDEEGAPLGLLGPAPCRGPRAGCATSSARSTSRRFDRGRNWPSRWSYSPPTVSWSPNRVSMVPPRLMGGPFGALTVCFVLESSSGEGGSVAVTETAPRRRARPRGDEQRGVEELHGATASVRRPAGDDAVATVLRSSVTAAVVPSGEPHRAPPKHAEAVRALLKCDRGAPAEARRSERSRASRQV